MAQIPPEGEQKNSQPVSHLVSVNLFKAVVIPYVPLIIGLGILLFLKNSNSPLAFSLGFFIAGFWGVLRIIVYRQKPLSTAYSASRFVGDLLFILVCWG